MTTTAPTAGQWDWPDPGHSREHDIAVLASGGYTGWWDENGQPAPWPEDILDPDGGWAPARGGADPLTNDPGEPLF